MAGLADAFRDVSNLHTHVKIVRVKLAPDSARTLAYIEASGHSESVTVQQHAAWECQWERGSDNKLRLASIQTDDYEEVTASGPHGVWFSDGTTAVLKEDHAFRRATGLRIESLAADAWSGCTGCTLFARWGIAVGDVNGDGWTTSTCVSLVDCPTCLYVQNPDGTASDRSGRGGSGLVGPHRQRPVRRSG